MTLVGRDSELAALSALLDSAREGRSGALLLRGEAGIGKTALLQHAAGSADGFRVLRATGIESEAELPYATLHQLLRPLEDRIDALAEPQAHALRGALGLAHEQPADRFLVGVGTLTLLADAADDRPLLAVLDDAAWFDRSSADVLGFVARRLQAESVVLLFAVRDEPGRQFALPGVEELVVSQLEEHDSRRLLGDGLEAGRCEQVLARAAGNPLALLELSRSAADGATGAEQAYVSRVAELPEDTQTLLLIAAADATQSSAVVGAAAQHLGLGAAVLEPAELDGLVVVDGPSIEFRHPLVRSAVYHSAPFARRARAHLALAAVLDGEENADRRAWHHASAVLGTDDDAADELERTAGRARARGGQAAASVSLERAADLTRDPRLRAGRLVAAADAAGLAGDGDRAHMLVERAGSGLDDELMPLAALVRGSLAIDRATMSEACDWFLQALTTGRTTAPGLALKAAVRTIEAAWQAGLEDRFKVVRELAREIEPTNDDDRSAWLVVQGLSAFAADDFEAAFPALRRAAELASASENPQTLLHGAWGSAFSGDPTTAHELVSKGERLARSGGAIGVLSVILMSRASWELSASNFTPARRPRLKG